LERLYPKVFELVRARLGAHLRSILESGDLVHEGLIEALRGLAGFRGTTEAELNAWCATLVENRIRQADRRRRAAMRDPARERSLHAPTTDGGRRDDPPAPGPSPSEDVSRLEQEERLLACLRELDEPYRRVIVLRHTDGMTWEAIAAELASASPDAARMLYQRARIELRKRVERR
jgi:RNA polymerase sigma-70 factor (ECF subfamily)